MLTGGMVKDEQKRAEYLRTLHAEADRLSRLVANVLDFSRLEKQRPRLIRSKVAVSGLLEGVRQTWQGRCHDAGKDLVIENALPPGAELTTDTELAGQVLANLIDNACKYSRCAEDRRVWVRALRGPDGRVQLEVEDCGPGVASAEQRSVFRPFRRGSGADVRAGGVGLGLALARRWAGLLGGRLTVHRGQGGVGARFRLELPPRQA
jgi:signal transduction histidine kinase